MEAAAIPGVAIPLLQDDCKDTTVDLDWVWDVIHLTSDDRTRRLDLDALRNGSRDAGSRRPRSTPCSARRTARRDRVARSWLAAEGKRWRPFLTACAYKALQDDPEQPLPDRCARPRSPSSASTRRRSSTTTSKTTTSGATARHAARRARRARRAQRRRPAARRRLPPARRLRRRRRRCAPSSSGSPPPDIASSASARARSSPGCAGRSRSAPIRCWTSSAGRRRRRFRWRSASARRWPARPPETQQVLRDYSEALGIAYQIRDDLEDLADTESAAVAAWAGHRCCWRWRATRRKAAGRDRVMTLWRDGRTSAADRDGVPSRCSTSSASRIARGRCSKRTRNRPFERCRRCRTRASRDCCGAWSAKSSASRSRAGAVSLRLEMLQVARLAPKQLGESRDLVTAFLRAASEPGRRLSGSRRRERPLLHRLRARRAASPCRNDLPIEQTAAYLERFGDGAGLDFVHLACLARGWAALRRRPTPRSSIDCSPASKRAGSDDGGYATTPRAAHGTAYGAFLAMGAYQDLGRALPAAESVVSSLQRSARSRRQLRQSSRPALGTSRPRRPRPCSCCVTWTAPLDRTRGPVAARSLPRARRLLCVRLRARSRSALDRDGAARPVGAARAARAACAIRASTSSTRSGPIAAASSAPGPTTRWTASTRITRCWRWATSASTRRDGARSRAARRGTCTPSSAGCSIGARLPTTGKAVWRAARSRRRPPCSRFTPRRRTVTRPTDRLDRGGNGRLRPGCFSIRMPTAGGATPSAVEATSARRRSCWASLSKIAETTRAARAGRRAIAPRGCGARRATSRRRRFVPPSSAATARTARSRCPS